MPASQMPEKIGHYTVVSELGRGGMGVVYKAREDSLNRFVAIKVLAEHLSSDETFFSRFIREARAAAALSHPNVIPIYFIGEDQGRHYFAMEYVSGRSLHSMIKAEGRISNPRATQLILQAAQGLAAAHDQGIIHRDIKPANLMVDDHGVVKIADFGVALPGEAQMRLTATGMLVGTPGYLSPEHCSGHPVDHRSDIYALGVSYYEMLSGRLPFAAESPLALLRQILQEEPPDIAALNPEVDPESHRILAKMIAKDPNARYQDCHELIAELETYLSSRGIRSSTAGLGTRAARNAAGATMVLGTAKQTGDVPTLTTPAAGASRASTPVTAAPKAGVTQPDAPRPSAAKTLVETPAAPPRRSGAWIAVAAVALLLLAGGGFAAWTLSKSFFSRGQSATAQAGMLSKPSGSLSADGSRRSANAPANTLTATPSQESIELSATKPSELDLTASPTAEPSQSEVSETQETVSKTAAPVSTPSAGSSSAGSQTAQNTKSLVERREERRAARREAAAEIVNERAASSLSGVVVIVSGDPGLDGAVQDVLTSEMEAAGQRIGDANDLDIRADAPQRALVDAARDAGFATVVIARIEPTGQRNLSYLGRNDVAYGSRITLTAIDTQSGRAAGKRQNTTLEYTQLNAARQAEKILGPLAQKLAESLSKN